MQAEGGCPASGGDPGHGPHFPDELAKIPVDVHMDCMDGGCHEREHGLRVTLNVHVAIVQADAPQPREELSLVYLPNAEDALVYYDLPRGYGWAREPQADDVAGAREETASPQHIADIDTLRVRQMLCPQR
jgi:hypothetical protein